MTVTDTDLDKVHKRTAVLVVHGIGSQRALETVRGVIKGVWLNSENPYDAGRRLWSHPQRDGADIDLTVMTTNEVPESKDQREVDPRAVLGSPDERNQAGCSSALAVRALPKRPHHEGGDQRPLVGRVHLPVPYEPIPGVAGDQRRGHVCADVRRPESAGGAIPADHQLSRVRPPDRFEVASFTACEEAFLVLRDRCHC